MYHIGSHRCKSGITQGAARRKDNITGCLLLLAVKSNSHYKDTGCKMLYIYQANSIQ